jgi:2-methoxy-6-polyprenyl-1,4-benzoquinol methylase
LYDTFSFDVIPVLGQTLASDRNSYQYLVESIRRFPPQSVYADMIRSAGFTIMGKGWEDLSGGIAAVHQGFKL